MRKIANKRIRYPLHVYIGVLFIAMILAVCTTIAWFSYSEISTSITKSTDALFEDISRNVVTTIHEEYRPVTKAVEILSHTPISRAKNLTERLQHLPILAEAINNHTHVTGLNIGYANGDYLLFRSTAANNIRSMFTPPPNAHYIVDHLTEDEYGKRLMTRLFIDQRFSIIKTIDLGESIYDPRIHPWYINANQSADSQLTPPYYFFFLKKPGITISKQSPNQQTVIAADITLEGLSQSLGNKKISASAISILYNDAREILAYNDDGSGQSIFNNSQNENVLTIAALQNRMLQTLHRNKKSADGTIPFTVDGANWLGDIRKIKFREQLTLNLLIAAPKEELFATAFAFRQKSMLITLGVIVLALPLAWIIANQIARPLRRLSDEAKAITDFDFSQSVNTDSFVLEIHQLSGSMEAMKTTIGNFLNLITSLSAESDVNRLLDRVTKETMNASGANGALIYLLSEDETTLVANTVDFAEDISLEPGKLPALSLANPEQEILLVTHFKRQDAGVITLKKSQQQHLHFLPLFDALKVDTLTLLALPLKNRNGESTGILCLIHSGKSQENTDAISQNRIGFSRALSGFAAVSMESRQLIYMQKALLQAFIQLIASAIDAKSPYTGCHCQRVPELTKMLAAAACESEDEYFKDFDLDEEQWEELHIAAWLHDCGKVTTPEYVVDKSTKLETIYDRIHEVRMRFEVLKREADINYWRAIAAGDDQAHQIQIRDDALRQLDEDFAFVAQCNVGGEFMSDDSIERLQRIATQTWQRTIDDRLGISWDEQRRKERSPANALPVEEPLIADKPEHLFSRREKDHIPPDNPYGFKVDTPEHKYNRGEFYNLSVKKGTLTAEERFKINEHMVQTITMLNQLPYPRRLRNVPEIAGGHHETMDGKGYPKRLRKEDMSLTARMMAIADIFEALTAADRPYKKAKTLSESLQIMYYMKKDQHIDPDLFDLFLRSGVYLEYGKAFLAKEQIDDVDISRYLS